MTQNSEMIYGYRVHPAASVFPLMEGEEFENLVESIRARGVIHPIVVLRAAGSGQVDELLDGRNRLRAAAEARNRGVRVDVPVVEWTDDGRNIASWIWDTNAVRRQMTDDGFAIASAAIWPLIAKENEARRDASKFTSEKAKAARATVTTKSSEPSKRDRKAEDARSTVGQVAAKAGTSMHKARQAIAVQKAIEAGAVSPDAAKQVMEGKKKLREVVNRIPPTPNRKNKRSLNRNAEHRLVVLLIGVRNKVESLDKNTDEDSPRRKRVAGELRRLANQLAPAPIDARDDIEPDRMLEEISYHALSFLNSCPERAGELEDLLVTWVSRSKQR